MHDYDFFIKPPERFVASYEYSGKNTRSLAVAYWIFFGIAFFLLPIFLTLQWKGLLLWLAMLVLIVRFRSRISKPYSAVLGTEALYKVDVKKKLIEWRVPLSSIEEIRVRNKAILIRQRKKVYLLGAERGSSHFADTLRTFLAHKS